MSDKRSEEKLQQVLLGGGAITEVVFLGQTEKTLAEQLLTFPEHEHDLSLWPVGRSGRSGYHG